MSIHRKEVMRYDPITGMTRIHQFDNIDGKHVVSLHQEVEHVLDRNKALANRPGSHASQGTFRHVASIPLVVIELWLRKYGIWVYKHEHWPAVKKLLNDPEWRYLRTDTSVL